MKGCPYPSEPEWTPCRPDGVLELYRSGRVGEARRIASSVPPWSVPDEDLGEFAPLYEMLGLDGAGGLWRRHYLLHPDSRALEGVRRTDPDADIRGLLLQAMDREREASADWRPLRPGNLAHLVYEGFGEEVARLVRSKEGTNPAYVLDNTGRVEAVSLCRELARIGRYREAAFIGRTAVESFMYASRDSFLVHAVNLVRFMDSVPGFEDADPPQSEYIASLRADGRMQREFWELYDRQRVPKRRVGYIWRDYRFFEHYDNYKDYNEIVIYSLRVDASARKDRMDGSEARLEEGT